MKVKKQTSLDTKMYIFIRTVAFLGASVVSAIFNLLLFQGMVPQKDLFLLAVMSSVSIVLELTKISTVITANLFRDIFQKTKIKAINIKKNIFFTLYFMLTILSIIASLGFTFVLNDKMSSSSAEQLDLIEGFQVRQKDIEQDELDLSSMKKELLEFDKDIKLANFSQQSSSLANAQATSTALSDAILKETQAKDLYNKFFDVNSAKEKMLELDEEENKDDYEAQREVFLDGLEILNVTEKNFDVQFQKAKDDKFNASAVVQNLKSNKQEAIDFDVDLTENEKDLVDLESSILVKQQEFLVDLNDYLKDTAVENEEIREITSMVEAGLYLASTSTEIKNNSGVNIMFREFGKLLNIDPTLITLIILLFVSVLIELTIFQTSPDLKPTRRILYYFRNHLKDVNVSKLFKAFDEEEKLWQETKKEEAKEIKEEPVQRLQEQEIAPFTTIVYETTLPQEEVQEEIVEEQEEIVEEQEEIIEETTEETTEDKTTLVHHDKIKEEVQEKQMSIPKEELKEEDPVKEPVKKPRKPRATKAEMEARKATETVKEPKQKATESEKKEKAATKREEKHLLDQAIKNVSVTSEATSPYEADLPPKQELKTFSEPGTIVMEQEEETKTYRFGRTTKATAETMKQLVDHIYKDVLKDGNTSFTLEEAKKNKPISDKAFDLLFKRLIGLSYDGLRLIDYDANHAKYTLNYNYQTLVNFLFEEI